MFSPRTAQRASRVSRTMELENLYVSCQFCSKITMVAPTNNCIDRLVGTQHRQSVLHSLLLFLPREHLHTRFFYTLLLCSTQRPSMRTSVCHPVYLSYVYF